MPSLSSYFLWTLLISAPIKYRILFVLVRPQIQLGSIFYSNCKSIIESAVSCMTMIIITSSQMNGRCWWNWPIMLVRLTYNVAHFRTHVGYPQLTRCLLNERRVFVQIYFTHLMQLWGQIRTFLFIKIKISLRIPLGRFWWAESNYSNCRAFVLYNARFTPNRDQLRTDLRVAKFRISWTREPLSNFDRQIAI